MTEPDRTAQSGDPGAGDVTAARPRRRRRLIPLAAGAVVVAAAGGGYWATEAGGEAEAAGQPAAPAATAEVVRQTLADVRTFSGTLGHGRPTTVGASGQGMVTGIAEQGAEVTRGTELYRLNERPVTALHGWVPMYRDLRGGDTGVDVEQLISNLTELGYADCPTEDVLTWCVQVAVREWQEDLGVEPTGTVSSSDVVFVPSGTQVDALHTEVGHLLRPGDPVVDLASSDQVVSLEVEVRDRDLLAGGAEVSVEVPGGEQVAGEVSSVETVAAAPAGGDSGGEAAAGAEDSVVQVEVTLASEVDDGLLGGPADVLVDVDQREDVLTVPVTALLALSEGGHAVEVVAADGGTSLVPVETGLFADGRVEVSGDGIAEGTVVRVAGR